MHPKVSEIIYIQPFRAPCPPHLILDLIIRKIFFEQYKSRSPSLRSFLQSPVKTKRPLQ